MKKMTGEEAETFIDKVLNYIENNSSVDVRNSLCDKEFPNILEDALYAADLVEFEE